MAREAELHDGTVLEFPDDTADDVIDRVVKSHLGVSAAPPATPSPAAQRREANRTAIQTPVEQPTAEELAVASRPARLTRTRTGAPAFDTPAVSYVPPLDKPPGPPAPNWTGEGGVIESLPGQFVAGAQNASAQLRRMNATESAMQRAPTVTTGFSDTEGGAATALVRRPAAQRQATALASDLEAQRAAEQDAAVAKKTAELVTPKNMSIPQQAVSSLAASSAPTLAGIAAGIITRSPALAMALAGGGGSVMQGAGTYGESMEAGRTHRQSAISATIDGILEGVGEALPLGFALAKGTPIAARIFNTMAAEAGQEAATQVMQDLHGFLTYSPNITLKEAWHNIQVAALAGAGGGAVYGGIGAAANKSQEMAAQKAQDAQAESQRIDEYIRQRTAQIKPSTENAMTGAMRRAAAPPVTATQQPINAPVPPSEQPSPVSQITPAADLDAVMRDERPLEAIRAEQRAQEEAAAAQAQAEADAAAEAEAQAQQQALEAAGAVPIGSRAVLTDENGNPETVTVRNVYQQEDGQPGYVIETDDGETFDTGGTGMTVTAAPAGDGTVAAPIVATDAQHVAIAAAQTNPAPTPAQKEADNYKKGRVELPGPLSQLGHIAIETAKGGERTAADGSWTVPNMPATYGHLSIADGNDGDKADVFIGDNLNARAVYVIDQIDPATGAYDETKSMVGFGSMAEAEDAYQRSFSDGSGRSRIGAVTAMTTQQFVARAKANNLKNAVSYKQPPKEKKDAPEKGQGSTTVQGEVAGSGTPTTNSQPVASQGNAAAAPGQAASQPADVVSGKEGQLPADQIANIREQLREAKAKSAAQGRVVDDRLLSRIREYEKLIADFESNKAQPVTSPAASDAANVSDDDFENLMNQVMEEGRKAAQTKPDREVIDQSKDTLIGANDAGEPLYERADGSRYRIHNGKPDFGGDLVPIEKSPAKNDAVLWKATWQTPHGPLSTVPMSEADAKKWAEDKGGTAAPISKAAQRRASNKAALIPTRAGLMVQPLDEDGNPVGQPHKAEDKPSLMNNPPPGGWKESDKVPEKYRKKSPAAERRSGNQLKALQDEAKMLRQGLPVAEDMIINDRGASLRRLQARIDENQRKQDELLAAPQKPVSESAKEAAQHAGKAVSKAMEGLDALFGGKGRLGSGPSFDEETWAKAKPLFDEAFQEAVATGKSLAEFVRGIFARYGEVVAPYLKRWHQELKAASNGPSKQPDQPGSPADQAGSGETSAGGRTGRGSGAVGSDGVAPNQPENGRAPAEPGDTGSDGGSVRGPQAEVGGGIPESGYAGGRGGNGSGAGTVDAGSGGQQPAGTGAKPETDTTAAGTGASSPTVPDQPPASDAPQKHLGNYHIDDPERVIGAGGPKARFAKNRAAIEAYNAATLESRDPTPAERDAMAGYIGWGSFGQELFQGSWDRSAPKEGWAAEDKWMRDHLGREQWESAQRSIINAHYTDPPTVQTIWKMVQAMGFKGGRVLEPSMGIGNFYGLMPIELAARSQLAGIEMDTLTGGMAKMMYPDANIQIKGYEESQTADNFYDLVIGNWPFAKEGPVDRRYMQLTPSLHDYFFLKALDQVRPGGLVIGITSAGTMDKQGRNIRLELAKKGELIAAFRMPSGAFEKYAGTAVVTDLIILRKRATPSTDATQAGWIESVPHAIGREEIHLNEYYEKNPENILGRLNWGHGTTSGRPGMIVERQKDFPQQLATLPDRVPKNAYQTAAQARTIDYSKNDTKERENSIIAHPETGELSVVRGEYLAPLDQVNKWKTSNAAENKKREAEIKALIGLRTVYSELVTAETTGVGDIEKARAELRKQYEAYAKKYGNINRYGGALKFFMQARDPHYVRLAALESNKGDKKSPKWTPAKIIFESTMRRATRIDDANIKDAFVIARNQSLDVDIDAIAKASKSTPEAVIKELTEANAIWKTPAGTYEVSDVYLSGNVRRKLREAMDAQAGGQDMARNIEALKAILPATVPYYQIEAKLGAPWVGVEEYQSFVAELLGLDEREAKAVQIEFRLGSWHVHFDSSAINHRPEAQTIWGVPFYPFSRLVQAAMNNLSVTIRVRDKDGNLVVDDQMTAEANEKATRLREEFSTWAFKDNTRRIRLETNYNEVMNAIADSKFDGSFLTMPGMALTRGDDPLSLREHQMNAIWRGLVNRRGIYAHEVGTGKTYTMGGIAVESRRYGIARKTILFAHNANARAVANEIQQMYPAASILFIDNLSPDNINITLHQIANDDWDVVVVPHSLVDRFSLKRETLLELAAEQIAQLEEEALAAAADDNVDLTVDMMDDEEAMKKVRSPTAKELVHARQKILKMIEESAIRSSREGAISFEELGVDNIMIDEVQAFKKPALATKMRLKGLNKSTSNRSIGMNFLTSYVKRLNGGTGVHVFTGTPITNTLNEIYNLQHMVADDLMEKDGIKSWDSWFNTFADSGTDVELTPAGEYEAITRLASFVNVAELRSMISTYTDIVFADDMPEFVPRTTASGKSMRDDLTESERDELANGRSEDPVGRPYKRIINDVGQLGARQAEILNMLVGYANDWKKAGKKQRREWMLSGDPRSPILVETAAANAGLDARLYDITAPDDPGSKENRVVKRVTDIYKSSDVAAQVIFVDRGYSDERVSRKAIRGQPGKFTVTKKPGFNLVKSMVEKLVAGGIPEDQIKIVNGDVSKEKRAQIAADMNSGKVRVVIGLSTTLGVGVNMQTNLRAMHHMDAPWTPGDLEQRNGRGWRQGNKWNTVEEYRYITERLDGRRWQVLAIKERFIKAFLKADKSIRIIDGDATDMTEDALSDLTQSLSEAAGDPRVMQREKLRKDIDKLDRRERAHIYGTEDAANQARDLTRELNHEKRELEEYRADVEFLKAKEDDQFSMSVGDKTYTDRKDAQAAIDKVVKALDTSRRHQAMGNYKGVTLSLYYPFKGAEVQIVASIDRANDSSNFFTPVYRAKASVASLEAVLRNIGDTIIAKVENRIAAMEDSIPRLMAAAKQPYQQAEKLQSKKQQLQALEADLDRNPIPPPSWLRHGAPVGTLVYVNRTEYVVEGHTYMPGTYGLIVSREGVSDRTVPYDKVTDENGNLKYEAHPFEKPEAINRVRPGTVMLDKETGEPWAIVRGPYNQRADGEDVQIVFAENKNTGSKEERRVDQLKFQEAVEAAPVENWWDAGSRPLAGANAEGITIAREPIGPTKFNIEKILSDDDIQNLTDKVTTETGREWDDEVADYAIKDYQKWVADGRPELDVDGQRVTPVFRKIDAGLENLKKQDNLFSVGEGFSDRFLANRDEITRRLTDIARQLAPKVTFEAVDHLFYGSRQIAGRQVASRNLIEVALNYADPETTLRHEVIHALRSLGLFSDAEWAVLERQAEREWRQKFNIDFRYAGIARGGRAMNEESIADAFGAFRAGEKFGGLVLRAFNKIREFLQRTANMLQGMGFQTANDIFNRIESGEVGNRTIGIAEYSRLSPAFRQQVADDLNSVAEKFAESSVGPVWFSALSRAVDGLSTNAAPAQGWKSAIKGLISKGLAKQVEVDAVGLNEWLDLQTGKISKEQITQFLGANGVRVEDVLLGRGVSGSTVEKAFKDAGYTIENDDDESVSYFDRDGFPVYFEDLPAPLQDAVNDSYKEIQSTKFSGYQLPGGENYREMLLTLPSGWRDSAEVRVLRERAINSDRRVMAAKYGTPEWSAASKEAMETRSRLFQLTGDPYGNPKKKSGAKGRSDDFRSTHFDQPNILAHIRFNERTDADGKRVLFIEEIQSDWAQKGKREGFIASAHERAAIEAEYNSANTEMSEAVDFGNVNDRTAAAERLARATDAYNARINDATVPTAPFVTKTEAWVGLSLKRMIRYAAENGFDRVAWTTGEQQAARYDLSKQVKSISYHRLGENSYDFSATGLYGDPVQIPGGTRGVTAERVAEVVGKDIAERMSQAKVGTGGTLRGNDLKVGGEGMKAFYDKIVPNVANDILKKLGGGRVTDVKFKYSAPYSIVKDGAGIWAVEVQASALHGTKKHIWKSGYESFEAADSAGKAQFASGSGLLPAQPGFDITPAVRQTAMRGMPKFALGAPTKQTDTPAFRKWFGDSKVVDADGNPLVVYHGPGSVGITSFNVPAYFAKDAETARAFSEQNGVFDEPIAAYLSIKNPFIPMRDKHLAPWITSSSFQSKATISALESLGFDGMVGHMIGGGMIEYVAFRPEQIKSAIGNRGTFDATNPDIRYAVGNPPPNITVVKREESQDVDVFRRFLWTPRDAFQGYPALNELQKFATNIDTELSKTARRLTHDFDLIRDRLDDSQWDELSSVLWMGDAEATEYTRQDLIDGQITDPKVQQAYDDMRTLQTKAGRLVDMHNRSMMPQYRKRKAALLRRMAGLTNMNDATFRSYYGKRTRLRAKLRAGIGDPILIGQMLDAIEDRLNIIREAQEEYAELQQELDAIDAKLAKTSVRKRVGYVPHKFFGSYAVYRVTEDEVIDPETLQPAVDASGNPVMQDHHELIAGEHGFYSTIQEAIAAAKATSESDPGVKLVVRPVQFKFPNSAATTLSDASYWRLMTTMSKELGLEGKDLHDAMADVARRRFRRRVAGFAQFRKGVAGYSKDLEKVMRAHLGEVTRYVFLDKLKYRAINDMERMGLTPNRSANQKYGNLSAMVNAYLRDMNGQKQPTETAVDDLLNRPWASPALAGAAATAVSAPLFFGITTNPLLGTLLGSYMGYRFYSSLKKGGEFKSRTLTGDMISDMAHLKLGMLFNVYSAAVNLTQTVVNTLPVLGAKHTLNGMLKLEEALRSSIMGKPNSDYRLLERTDTVSKFQYHDSGNQKFLREGNLAYYSLYFFTKAEQFNRAVSFLGAYYRARGNGDQPGPAFKAGESAMLLTQHNYGQSNKPEILRNVFLRLPLQFKNFLAQQLAFTWHLGRYGLTGENRTGVEMPRHAIATHLTSLFLVAGAIGLPFMGLLAALLKGIFDWDPLEEMKKQALLAQASGGMIAPAANVLTRGMPSLIGDDLSTRAGMGDKFLPMSTQDLQGPWWGTISKAVALGELQAGWVDQLVNLSGGIGKPLKSIEAAANGLPMTTMITEPKLWFEALADGKINYTNPWKNGYKEFDQSGWDKNAVPLNTADLVKMAVGGTPLKVNQARDIGAIDEAMKERDRRMTKMYMGKIINAVRLYEGKDDKKLDEVMGRIEKQMEAAGFEVNQKQVQATLRAADTPRLVRVLKATPKKLRPLIGGMVEGLSEQNTEEAVAP